MIDPQAPLNIGMIGCGTVGGGVVQLLNDHAQLYEARVGRPIALKKVLVRNPRKAIESAGLDAGLVTDKADAFFDTPDLDAVIEVAGGLDPVGGLVERALENKLHVITANKSLLAARGADLFGLARKHGVSIAFEASCGGGIPCVTALQQGLMANAIHGLYGILNGTCNYILTEMTQAGKTYADALAEAKEKGYAEADETLDVSGADAAQKLAILASLAFGVSITGEQVPCHGIDSLDLDDVRFGDELGYDIKLIASAERWPGSEWVCLNTRPSFISKTEQLAQVHGSYNALSVVGDAVGHTMYYGQGAGAGPTASAVVSDLLGVASGWIPQAFKQMQLTPDLHGPAKIVEQGDTESRWYLRINAMDQPNVMAKVTKALGDRGISLSAILQHDATPGQPVPVVITTHKARLGDLEAAATEIDKLEETHGDPVIIRILDLPG
jgi:homoserine dehydrogenase